MTDVAALLRGFALLEAGEEKYRIHSLGTWSPRKWLVLVWLEQDAELSELVEPFQSPLRDYETARGSWDPLERLLATQPGGGPWPNRLTADITLSHAAGAGLVDIDTTTGPRHATITPPGRRVIADTRLALESPGSL
jgi:hypothetical protein